MSEPSRDAFVFAGFLAALSVIASYLRIPEAATIVSTMLLFAGFIIGYRMGLPVVPVPEPAAVK